MYTIDDFRPPHFHSRACPFCKVDLIKKPFTTVSTGCCFQCGRRVLDFPEQKSEPVHTCEEIIKNCGGGEEESKPLVYLVIFISLSPVLWPIFNFAFGKKNQWIHDILIFGFILLMTAWTMIALYIKTKRTYHCEHCRLRVMKNFVPYLALTGRCPKCAQQIVKDLALPTEKVGTPRLNIDTFFKEWKATRRRMQYPMNWASVWLGFMLIMFVMFVVVSEFLFPLFKDRLAIQLGAINFEIAKFAVQCLWALLAFGPLALATIRFSKALSQEDRDEPGINCPSCSKTIFNSEISIATKRCHHCREVVFNEPEPMPAEGNGTAHVGLV